MRERGLKYPRMQETAPEARRSLPMRERGLKSLRLRTARRPGAVAPHAGAWIEIGRTRWNTPSATVAPHAGAWIEIPTRTSEDGAHESLPMRERGLKFVNEVALGRAKHVAPHAGAWIEILGYC